MSFSYQPQNVTGSKASNSQGMSLLLSYLMSNMGKGGSAAGSSGDTSNPAGGTGPSSGDTSLANMITTLTGQSGSGFAAGATPTGFSYDLPSTSTMGASGGKGLNSY